MRPYILAALASIALAGPALSSTALPDARTAESASATPSVSKDDAKEAARAYLKEKNLRGAMVGASKQVGGDYHFRIQNHQGISMGTVVVDGATGKVRG